MVTGITPALYAKLTPHQKAMVRSWEKQWKVEKNTYGNGFGDNFLNWLKKNKIISRGAATVGAGIGALFGSPQTGLAVGKAVGSVAGSLGYGSMYSPYLANVKRRKPAAVRRTRK